MSEHQSIPRWRPFERPRAVLSLLTTFVNMNESEIIDKARSIHLSRATVGALPARRARQHIVDLQQAAIGSIAVAIADVLAYTSGARGRHIDREATDE